MEYNKGRFHIMQAIILCGGKGTRLREVIGERQKVMTAVQDTPFLVDVLNYLKSYKITSVVFATGYKSDEVRSYFGDKYFFGVEVRYSEEKEPLGTGGAIRLALDKMKYDYVYVLNGDTLFKADLYKLKENFMRLGACMSIACKTIEDKSRYGTIKLDFSGERTGGNKEDGILTSFDEKVKGNHKHADETFINGGVYILRRDLIESIEPGKEISLEKDLMPKWLSEGKIIGGVLSDESFIDIGTPESLKRYKDIKENEEVIDG